ncbi:hypothetical protein F3Y22_tig00112530pilonHSYRG00147 [Hibiscus syriacus]|uniref:Uncharacterized protein n=1 Tax=Hibiscus syriacus TaxID=106335 RepID=A0A6A2X932_HIBSY|nr:hypothetical protein F3Y22_tig00112530pilonHSYRG00147 [Hibiscus syriacus]
MRFCPCVGWRKREKLKTGDKKEPGKKCNPNVSSSQFLSCNLLLPLF